MKGSASRRVGTLLVASLVVAPVWLVPVLPTTDGPSHLYNAMIGHALATGSELYGPIFDVAGGIRPNLASWELLGGLGPVVGWPVAERLLASLASLAVFGACVALWTRFGREDRWLLYASAAGWFASSWFLWMGFYDFSLALALLFLLPVVLDRAPGPGREALLYPLMGGLYFTHLFGFAVGLGLCLADPLWRAAGGGGSGRSAEGWAYELPARLPLAVLLLVQLAGGGLRTGPSIFAEFEPFRSLAGVLLGDYLLAFSRLDLVGSLPVTVLLLAWLLHTVRRGLAGDLDWRGLPSHVVFGAFLMLVSVLLPDLVAEGEFVLARLRIIGAAFLLAAVAGADPPLRIGKVGLPTALLLGGLVIHGGTVVRSGQVVDRDLHDVERMARDLGARRGAWTQNPVLDWHDQFFRVDPYSHLDDRLNLEQGLIAAEDYEAFRGAFPIRYTTAPNRLAAIEWPEERQVELLEESAPWPDTLYVLLPGGFRPASVGPGVEWGPVRRTERVTVARVALRRPGARR